VFGYFGDANRRREATMKRFVLFGILLSTAGLPARERIALHISPAVAFAPANLVVQTTVEANARNRAIEIVAESPDFYRSSEIQLDGENAPRTTRFEFRSLPPGNYEVTARLLGSDGAALVTVRQMMNVIASGAH